MMNKNPLSHYFQFDRHCLTISVLLYILSIVLYYVLDLKKLIKKTLNIRKQN